MTWRRQQGQSLPDAPSIPSRSSVAEQSLDKRSTDVRFITGGPHSRGAAGGRSPQGGGSGALNLNGDGADF